MIRDLYWFNEIGNPVYNLKITDSFGFVLVIFSLISLKSSEKAVKNKYDSANYQHTSGDPLPDELSNSFSLSHLFILLGLGFIGVVIFTSGLKYIPLFSNNMDMARVQLQESDVSGRGIGFILMLGLLHGIGILYLKYKNVRNKNYRYLFILLIPFFYFPLLLYSGRLLLLIPLILIVVLHYLTQNKINYYKVIPLFLVFIIVLGGLFYFATIRVLGKGSSDYLILRYLWADIFPEFRMFVYFSNLTEANIGDVIYGTFFSGLFPGSFLGLFGIDKSQYYIPIGKFILSYMQHFGSNLLGIRISLIGELYMGGGVFSMLINGSILLAVLHKVNKNFIKEIKLTRKKYLYFIISIMITLSIPYGTLFLITTVQFSLFSYLILRYVKKKNP